MYRYGVRHGKSLIFHPPGNLVFDRHYRFGSENGLQKMYREDGSLWMDAELKLGKRSGISHYYFRNGQIRFEANLKDGKINGLMTTYDPEGRLLHKGNFQNGLEEGIHMDYHYHENGVVKETRVYKKGKLLDKNERPYNGIYKQYAHDVNLIAETVYKGGFKNGISKTYYADGSLEVEENYEENVLKTRKTFYKKGGLESEADFTVLKDSSIDWKVKVKIFDKSGELISEDESEYDKILEAHDRPIGISIRKNL